MQALYSWDASNVPLETLLGLEWVDESAAEDSLAFARLIISGAIEQHEAVDRAISAHLDHWDISRIARVDLAILRMAAYSLLFQPDVPASVTINEAVDIAKEFGSDESYRFVNGVLDSIRRDPNS
jgi:N utilization substance protein B